MQNEEEIQIEKGKLFACKFELILLDSKIICIKFYSMDTKTLWTLILFFIFKCSLMYIIHIQVPVKFFTYKFRQMYTLIWGDGFWFFNIESFFQLQ